MSAQASRHHRLWLESVYKQYHNIMKELVNCKRKTHSVTRNRLADTFDKCSQNQAEHTAVQQQLKSKLCYAKKERKTQFPTVSDTNRRHCHPTKGFNNLLHTKIYF
jgi:hypothetical protein